MRFYAGALIFALVCLATLAIFATGGSPFVYPLDDTYIHLAIARTLAEDHIWGAVAGQPAAASSSPLWTVLLAALYKIWPNDAVFLYAPLALNALAAALLIFVLARALGPGAATPWRVAAILVAASVPALAALGMEHVLHGALTVALVVAACGSLARGQGEAGLCALLATLAVATRYESLFVVAPLVGLALVLRRVGLAAALVGGALLPILAFGALWVHDGGWLLPNTLILKRGLAEQRGLLDFVTEAWANVRRNVQELKSPRAWVAFVCLSALLALVAARARRKKEVLIAIAAFATIALHFAFASTGWLYRYEAWLILLLATSTAMCADALPAGKSATSSALASVLAVAAATVVVFGARTFDSTEMTVQAMDDRRMEHITTADFVAANYSGQTVMLNDLGAVAWFAPRTVTLDIYGLGSNEPIRRMLRGAYGQDGVAAWAKETGTRIAILQPCWPIIWRMTPDSWNFVATWKIPRNVVFGDRYVGFYAVADGEADRLRERLKAFALPPEVALDLSPGQQEIRRKCDNGL